jgi:hypothetical protein
MSLRALNSTNNTAALRIFNASTSLPAPGLVLSSLPVSIAYKPEGGTPVPIALVGGANPNWRDTGDGSYEVTVPDPAYTAITPRILIEGTYSGHVIIGDRHQVVPALWLSSLQPVTNQLDTIEETLAEIQAKTDTIKPPSTGPHRLTITATDDGDQLAGALVRILGVAGTLRTTEADAPSLIDLGPGDYTIRITPPALFDAPADIPVTLPGPSGDISIAIPLTRAAIIPPAAGNLCAVAVRIADPSDTPVASATVRAYLTTGPLLNDTIHTGKTTDTTNAAGLATLHLLRSQTYEIEAQIGGTLTTIRRTIPDAPNAVLSATLPA